MGVIEGQQLKARGSERKRRFGVPSALSLQPLDLNWRRLLSYVWPYRVRLAVAIVALMLASATGLAIPLAAGGLVNAITAGNGAALLNKVALALVGIVVAQAALNLVQTYQLAYVGERVVADMRTQVYTHIQRLSLSFFNDRRVGEITSRVTNDVTTIQSTATTSIASFLQTLLQFVGALVLMCVLSWQLTGLVLVLAPAMVALGVFYGRRVRRLSTEVQDKLADTSSVLEETVAGVRIVQSFAREPYEVRRFGRTVEEGFAIALRRARVRALFEPLLTCLGFGGLVLVLWVGGRLVQEGSLRPGDLLSMLLYGGSIAGALSGFTSLFTQIQQALGATQRVFELLDTAPEIVDGPDAQKLPPIGGHVRLEAVSFRYREGAPLVLEDITLEAQPGERVALVGPSGAGKTTLVNLIPRFYELASGQITVDGHNIRDVQLRSLREQIGIVPQETALFNGTIRDNILYGSRDERDGQLFASDEELTAAAQAANAHDFILALPDGYNTLVGDRGVKLSGGQRQRVAIARALLKDPRILILDEATSSLDSESEGLVQEALERLMQGRTTFVIAHRLSTVRNAHRIAVISGGRVADSGTHEELLARGGLYARLYQMQFRDPPAAQQLSPPSERYIE
ncbi:MAG: ABC transporter ATP-binding protein [Chloroflexales bacterium]|nr:ABC transporter ATP-binding protein [Chloroflexales bacterium]